MNSLLSKNLSFFLTYNSSLSNWHKSGLLSREIAPYNELAKHLNKIYIFSYSDKKDLEFKYLLESNIKIITKPKIIPSRLYKFIAPFIHFKIIRKSHLLKTNQMSGAQTAIMAKLINPKAKLIIRTGYTVSLFNKQANQDNTLIKKLERNAYKKCDLALVTSKADKEYLLKNYPIKNNKIEVVTNYIDTKKFKPEKINKYSHKIIFVGRAFDPQKNITSLIDALKKTDLELDIIGQDKNTTKLKDQAKTKNVTINFLGTTPNEKLPEILNQYKIFVLPSLYEGMPKALLEAMSCGLACIATNVAGNQEVIKNNENGLLCETSPQSLREAITKLINNNDLIEKLGRNARKYIVENFSLKEKIKNEIKIYENLINA